MIDNPRKATKNIKFLRPLKHWKKEQIGFQITPHIFKQSRNIFTHLYFHNERELKAVPAIDNQITQNEQTKESSNNKREKDG